MTLPWPCQAILRMSMTLAQFSFEHRLNYCEKRLQRDQRKSKGVRKKKWGNPKARELTMRKPKGVEPRCLGAYGVVTQR